MKKFLLILTNIRHNVIEDFKNCRVFFQRKRLFSFLIVTINFVIWVFLLNAGYGLAAREYTKTLKLEKAKYEELRKDFENCKIR